MSERNIDFRIFKDVCIHETRYSAGTQILGPGSPQGMMYVVKSGHVSVQLHGVTVEEVYEGGIFGELGMIDPRPHTAHVFAVTDVEVFVVNNSQFLQVIAQTPSFALRVMKIMARRLRAMNTRLYDESPDAEHDRLAS